MRRKNVAVVVYALSKNKAFCACIYPQMINSESLACHRRRHHRCRPQTQRTVRPTHQ